MTQLVSYFQFFMIFYSRLIQSIMCFLHSEYSMCFRIVQLRAKVYPNGRERPFFGRQCPQSHSSKISLSGNCFTGQLLKVLILAIVLSPATGIIIYKWRCKSAYTKLQEMVKLMKTNMLLAEKNFQNLQPLCR